MNPHLHGRACHKPLVNSRLHPSKGGQFRLHIPTGGSKKTHGRETLPRHYTPHSTPPLPVQEKREGRSLSLRSQLCASKAHENSIRGPRLPQGVEIPGELEHLTPLLSRKEGAAERGCAIVDWLPSALVLYAKTCGPSLWWRGTPRERAAQSRPFGGGPAELLCAAHLV